MYWICIGMIAGSLVVSDHKDKEACEGRAAMLREAKAASVKCVDLTPGFVTTGSGLYIAR